MPLAPLPRLAYANALLRMITEFSGLYPFVFQYVMHANEDTWLAVGVCLQAFTRLLGVPVATRVVWHPRPSLSLPLRLPSPLAVFSLTQPPRSVPVFNLPSLCLHVALC
jgi:hypothetical protein